MASEAVKQSPKAPDWQYAWNMVQKTPEFEQADDMEREAIRQDVFNKMVAPRVPVFKIDEARRLYDQRTAPRGDPTSGVTGDLWQAAKSGVWGALGDTAAGVTLGKSNAVSDTLNQWSQEAVEEMSPGSIQAMEQFGVDYDPDQNFHFREGSSLWGGALNTVSSLGSMAPLFAGGLVGRGVGMAGKVLGGVNTATKVAVAAGNAEKARKAMVLGDRIMKGGSIAGQSATMGLMMGGGTGQQAAQEIMAMDESELKKSRRYRIYLDKMNPEQARRQLAKDAAEEQFWPAAGMGAVSGALLGPTFEKIIGAKGAVSRLGNIGLGAVAEGGQEVLESGGQQYLSNLAQRDVGLDVNPWENVPGATATGALLGAAGGGGMAAPFRPRRNPSVQEINSTLEASINDAREVESQLSGDLEASDRANLEAELEKRYRRVMDLEAVRRGMKEEEQARDRETPKPPGKPPESPPIPPSATSAPSATSTPDTEPQSAATETSWVDPEIDHQIVDLGKTIRQGESNLKRVMQNGGTVDDAQVIERELAKNRALQERLQSLSRNRDKQGLFNTLEDFYSWIDLTIGSPLEQLEAKEQIAHLRGNPEMIRAMQVKHLAMRARPAIKKAKAGLLSDQRAERKLQRALDETLKEERYQEAVEDIPSHEDLKWEKRQIQKRDLAQRVSSAARQRLGSHQRQQQFEQLKAQHEQSKTQEKPPVAEQVTSVSGKQAQQEEAEADAGTLPAVSPQRTGPGTGPADTTHDTQRTRVKSLRDRLQNTNTPQNKAIARQLGNVAATMATHGNLTTKIDVHPITVTRGRVDSAEFNALIKALQKRAPASEQRRKRLANAAARLISQIGKRYAGNTDPLSKELVTMTRRIAKALIDQNDLTLDYGSDQQLKIEDGQVPARELKAFRQWLEGPQNTDTGYWKAMLSEIQNSRKGEPRDDKTVALEVLQRAMDKRETRKIGFAYPNTRHVNLTHGEPDHQTMVDFIHWLAPAKSLATAPPSKVTGKPSPRHRPDTAERLLKEAAARQRINKEIAERRARRKEETAREMAKINKEQAKSDQAKAKRLANLEGYRQRERQKQKAAEKAPPRESAPEPQPTTTEDVSDTHVVNMPAEPEPVAQPTETAKVEEAPAAEPDVSTKPEKVSTSEERVQETPESEQDSFRKALDELYENTDSSYLKGRIDSVISLMQQLKDAGTAFPDTRQFMDDIDNGNRAGFSRERQRKDLKGYKADLIGLDNGTVKPRKIGGTGTTKADAKVWLNQKIADLEFSLAHDGMMHHTNISNYAGTLKDIKNGKDEGFKSDEQLQKEREEREQYKRERDQEAEQFREIADRTYETGTHEGMNQPMWISFNVSHGADRLLAQVAKAKTPEEKFQLLNKDQRAKKQELSFREKVDFNHARKKNVEFGYFSIEKRKGYKLIKLAIDLKPSTKKLSKPSEFGSKPSGQAPAVISFDSTTGALQKNGKTVKRGKKSDVQDVIKEVLASGALPGKMKDYKIEQPMGNRFWRAHYQAPVSKTEAPPTTVFEAEQRLESNFADQYAGNKGDAPFAFVQSLVNRDYEKAIDDVARGKLTIVQADDVANAALTGKALTQDEFDTFEKKLKQLARSRRPAKAPDHRSQLETDLAPIVKSIDSIIKNTAWGESLFKTDAVSYVRDVLDNLSIGKLEKRIASVASITNGGAVESALKALLNIKRKFNNGDYSGSGGIDWNQLSPSNNQQKPEAAPEQTSVSPLDDVTPPPSNKLKALNPENAASVEQEVAEQQESSSETLPGDEQLEQMKARSAELDTRIDQLTDEQVETAFAAINKTGLNRNVGYKRDALKKEHPDDIERALAAVAEESPNERNLHDQGDNAGTGSENLSETGTEREAERDHDGLPQAAGERGGDGSGRSEKERTGSGRHAGRDATDGNGSKVSEGDRTGPDHRGDTVPVRSENFRITENSLDIERSWSQKAKDNIEAIRILKQLSAENRMARPDEQARLVKYVGWGASELANNIFPTSQRKTTPEWQTLADELKALLSEKEWRQAASSVNYAHFTGQGIITQIYNAVKRFGLKSGLTFEAGSGIGHFMGLTPQGMNLHYTGVEMDPVSARISKALYPANGVLETDFIKMGLPENHFDLTLGNPPYANLKVQADPKYTQQKMQLHDYFIAKQIDSLKPGGIGVFITSSRTMDKQGQEFRDHVGKKANLIGAIRLPNTAFIQNAGAEVGTDLLFFQKKGEGIKDINNPWLALSGHPTLRETVTDSEGNTSRQPVQVNQYFIDNPNMILGTETMSSSQFGEKYSVLPSVHKKKTESSADYLKRVETKMQKDIAQALKKLPKAIFKGHRSLEQIAEAAALYDLNPEHKEDSFYIRDDGSIGQIIDGVGSSVEVMGGGSRKGLNKKQQQYVRDYIPLRNAVMEVYRQQKGSEAQWQKAVQAMEREYDRFVERNGLINQGRYIVQNRKDGKVIEMLREPVISTLDMDPEMFRVAAIEHYDIDSNKADKARIFRERILGVEPKASITSAQDAVSHTLNTTGWLDMEAVQHHYPGHALDDIVSELGNEVFMDPASGKYVVRDAYLSGNVKAKLRDAKEAADDNPALQRNVRSLEEVIPQDLPISAVPMKLGGLWVPENIIQQFAEQEMGIRQAGISKFRHRELSSWKVTGFAHTSPFATRRMDAMKMLEAALNQKTIVIRDYIESGGNKVAVVNSKETAAANSKKQQLKEAFERWAKNNGQVADTLQQIYNRDFNTNVNRHYNGSHLTFPGMTSRVKLRPHQADVVWRIIQNGNTYMAHAVGAGKTMASISAAMEMKRLGLVNKPTFAVLKSTLKQFSAEFLELYPNARILVADEKQLDKKNRRRFVAKMAGEDWDAVIMTHQSFQSLPMSDQYIEQHIDAQIEELQTMLEGLPEDQGLTRKQVENRIKGLQQKLEKLAQESITRKDRGMTFEETGIDFLFIDEAHTHKKVGFPTEQDNIKGVDSNSSSIAQDLFMKTQYLEGVRPGKHTVLMSGTPVSNTMGELFNIQRYLQPKVLEANMTSSFDSWSSSFAETTTNIEMQADGGFKPVTRMTKFVGVPGLMRDVLQIMDYVGMEEMREKGLVKLPKVNKDIPVTERSEGLKAYQEELGERIKKYENLSGKEKRQKGVDNILSILNDGRAAAVDLRLVNRRQEGPSKLETLIDNVFQEWQDTRENVYQDKEGRKEPTRGGIQLIFSDLVKAYNRETGEVTFNAYEYIRNSLEKRGIPREQIAFIGDYTNSMKKKRLFADMNAGRKTILIGGSDNLGTGVNVQKRLTTLHNLDINYVPAKMSQRLGRGERQGNQNPTVNSRLYVTEGTTDATVLQMNENKTRMADQVLRGDFSIHEMEDVSSSGDELAQAKAIASGNPLLMEQAGVMAEYKRYAAERDAHIDKLANYRRLMNENTQILESYERILPKQETLAKQYVSTRGDRFKATIKGKAITKRTEAGEKLLSHLEGVLTSKNPNPVNVAEIAGYDLYVQYNLAKGVAQLTFHPGDPDALAVGYMPGVDLTPKGVIAQVENRAESLSNRPDRTRKTIATLKDDISRYKKSLTEKFLYEEQLKKTKERLDDINRELEGKDEETETQSEASPEKNPDLEQRYRLADTPNPKGLKPYQAKTLQNLLHRATGGLLAKVVQSEAELPAHLRQQILKDGVSGRVKGVYDNSDNGRVYVIADRADSFNDALATVLHETIGHKGVRAVLGSQLNATLDQVYQSIPAKALAALRIGYASQIRGKTRTEQNRLLAEEYLAHLAETNPQHGLVKTVITKIRQLLRHLFPTLKWSNDEIRQLLMQARQYVQSGKTVTTNGQVGKIRLETGKEAKKTGKTGSTEEVRYQLADVARLDAEAIKAGFTRKSGNMKELIRRKGLGFLGGKQIAEIYSPVFDAVKKTFGHNPLQKLDKLIQQMASTRSNWAGLAEKIDQRWSRLARNSATGYHLLARVMHESTLYQVDPRKDYTPANQSIAVLKAIVDTATSDRQRETFQKALDKEIERKQAHERLTRHWQALAATKDAHELFNDVERYYRRQYKATEKALYDRLEGINLDPNARNTARGQIEALFHQALNGPYFPLMRFGDYVITATGPDGKPYRAHFENQYDRDQAKARLEKQGYSITFTGMRENFKPGTLSGIGEFSGKLLKALNSDKNTNIDTDAKMAFLDEVNQITLQLLPEMSAAKRGRHRKGIAGYNENARRAFSATALTGSNRLSRIQYGWQMEAELNRMKEAATESSDTSPLSDHQRDIAMQVHQEMELRHEKIMNPSGHPLAAHLTNAGFFWYMGASAGAGLVNMTQNLLIGLPQMAARHGFINTSKAMAKASKDYFAYGGKKPGGVDDLLQNAWFSLENAKPNKHISQDEIDLIKTLVADGTIETTQAHVLAQIADADVRPEDVKRKDWYTKATRASGLFFHNAEVANRQIAALTAYRLYKQQHGSTALKNGKATEGTVDAVRKAVFDAHYDYSSYNRPRHFSSNWAKVFLLFKQYSQNTTFFLARNFHQALKGESPQVRQQARKTLMTTLAMHSVFAGAMGLPGVSVMLWAAGLAMGDEDDPVDPEVLVRNQFSDIFGKTLGHALAKGAFNGFAGIDLHSRTSVNDLWVQSSSYDMPARQEAMYFLTNAMMGPLASQGINLWAGLDKVANGEQWQGMEMMMPKFIRDGMRSVRYAREGVQDREGKQILDDFSMGEKSWQLAGIGSARLSEAYEANRAVTGTRDKIVGRRNQLLRFLDRADSPQEHHRIQQQIQAFNEAQRHRQRTWAIITGDTIKRSLKGRRKRRQEAEHGLFLPATQLGMKDLSRFAALEH